MGVYKLRGALAATNMKPYFLWGGPCKKGESVILTSSFYQVDTGEDVVNVAGKAVDVESVFYTTHTEAQAAIRL